MLEELPLELQLKIILGTDFNGIRALFYVSRHFFHLIRDSKTLKLISKKYGLRRCRTFKQLLRRYDSKYISRRSLQYLSLEECFKLGAKQGRLEVLIDFLNLNPQLNLNRAARYAAHKNHFRVVEYLLNSVLFRLEASELDPLLIKVARRGQIDLTQKILEKNSRLDLNRAAWAAARGGHLQLINLLIERGATDLHGIAYGAAQGGHADLVRIFMEAGVRDLNGILCNAVYGGRSELVNRLLELGANDYDEALVAASIRGRVQLAQRMLHLGARSHFRAFQRGALHGHIGVMKLIPPLSVEEYNRIGLHVLLTRPHKAVLEYLLELGLNNFGTLSQIASRQNNRAILKLLDQKGVLDPHQGLIGGAEGGHLDLVLYMLERGAQTLLEGAQMAARCGHLIILNLILEEVNRNHNLNRPILDLNTIMLEGVRSGHFEIVNQMLDRGADNMNECLVAGAEFGQYKMVKLFLSFGANDLDTALIMAASEGHLSIVKLMLKRGATRIDLALIGAFHPTVRLPVHQDILRYLRAYRASSQSF